MKRNYKKSNLPKILLFSAIFCFEMPNLFAQPYPHMWVEKVEGQARRDWFMNGTPRIGVKSKYKLLKATLGSSVTTSITCPIDEICRFVDSLTGVGYVRFYFAEYSASFGNDMPSGFDDDLTLVIVPAFDRNRDRGDYYNIRSGTGAIVKITEQEKIGWTNQFDNSVLPVLNQTISLSDQDNAESPGKYSDSKSTLYLLDYLKEALDGERAIQEGKGNRVTGILIQYCSYPKNGIEDGSKKGHYKNRLILQFDFTRKSKTNSNNYEVFYIDENGRTSQPIEEKGLDNGQLCPTYCPNP